ncbi:MAG: (d)CMP kinase [Polyangiaceae bacterium]|nr:(d)CMP kinase [Polyangiaceae bacterium]
MRVAIDGPAGAGKGTAARGLSERLGYVLVDTGALYRTVALAVRRAGIDWDDAAAIGEVARRLAEQERLTIGAPDRSAAEAGGSGMRVLLDGEDVSGLIRTPEMSLGASRVSAVPEVRKALLAMQRQAGARGGVVLEGRDIGTVVLPDAEVTFFLTAAAEIRAKRRFDELVGRGAGVSFEETLADVLRRDKADSERAVAPLRRAEDAILVDSGHRSPAEIVEEMARVVESRARGG